MLENSDASRPPQKGQEVELSKMGVGFLEPQATYLLHCLGPQCHLLSFCSPPPALLLSSIVPPWPPGCHPRI